LAAISGVATAVTAGDLSHAPVAVSGNDEITLLGRAFNAMLQHIRTLVEQIKQSAEHEQARLEELVRARTHELNLRNADMRLVLDNVDQGFLGVDLRGQLSPERSAVLTQWLSEPLAADTLFSWIDRSFPGKGDAFRVAWDSLTEEWMPLELRIDQLPRGLQTRQHSFTFTYKPVFEAGALTKLLVVMSDVTAVVEKQRAQQEEHELAQVVRKLIEDRSGFAGFVSETDELVNALSNNPGEVLCMRLLHTFKGNSAMFGFSSLSALCHELETAVQEHGNGLTQDEFERLHGTWRRLKAKVKMLTEGRRDTLDVSRDDYAELLARLDRKVPPHELREWASAWQFESVDARLKRLADYARGLAERLDKGPIDVVVEANSVRLDPHAWASVWQALVHVVRNAVDHGIESREERVAANKSEKGVLSLRTSIRDARFKFEVVDSGRGIDWESVTRAAQRRGLPHQTHTELCEALLADGLSTRDEATDLSGRGVGLSAVKQACVESGGVIRISSQPGQGTSFSLEWSIAADHTPARVSRVSLPTVAARVPSNDVEATVKEAKATYVKAV
ncbi:MAG: hypothetical protein RL701_1646, partial [Pseudomonadota bacterium]